MPWFQITTTDKYVSQRNINVAVDDPDAAAARFIEQAMRPIYCRLHDEMPAAQRDGEIGSMGYFHPRATPPVVLSVRRMREVWMDCGTSLVPVEAA